MTSQLTTVATTMTTMPHSACSGRVPRKSRRTASTSKAPPTTAMTAVWRSPARFSALPCPKGCPSSAGESAIRIDRRLKLEIATSKRESAAAERRPIEFVASPAPSFPAASAAAAAIATRSARIFGDAALLTGLTWLRVS